MADHGIRRALREEADEAGDVLAAAFAADPVMLWLSANPADPDKTLRAFFRAEMRLEIRSDDHEVFVLTDDDGIAGVAIWKGIDAWKSSVVDSIRLAPGALRSRLLPWRALRLQAAMERAHPRAPHFFLAVFGVHTRARGRGYGAALLRHMTQRLDEQGIDGYLESSNPRNVSIYRRHGFEVSGDLDVPASAPPVVPMWRPTRNP